MILEYTQKGADPMKIILKLLALPVLLLVKILCILGNLLTNINGGRILPERSETSGDRP